MEEDLVVAVEAAARAVDITKEKGTIMKSIQFFQWHSLAFKAAVMASVVFTGVQANAAGEERFANTNDAIKAFVEAAASKDPSAMDKVFGPNLQELVSADQVQASNGLEHLAMRVKQRVVPVAQADSFVGLELGYDTWPFPIALVKDGGQWYFNTEGGKEEILNRRIGRNELDTIKVCHAFVQAEREYAVAEHGDGVVEYAQLLRSTPGKHDGLYWHANDGEETSPFGPLIAEARGQGYTHTTKIMSDPQMPYHGYYFKILTRQGSHAAGGKYNYIIHGHMVAGFALLAWPAQWDNSGVMTFMINQQGKIYEKNLGPKTTDLVNKIEAFDPGEGWKPCNE
jgi:hypothetical protein